MAPPSLRASQTLSTVTTASVGNNAVGAREDYLNCGHRLLSVLFFQTNAQHSSSQQSIQQFLIVVRPLCNARTFSLVKQDQVCFIRKFLLTRRHNGAGPQCVFNAKALVDLWVAVFLQETQQQDNKTLVKATR